VERADVSLQTFYRHFQGKDELLLALIEEAITATVEQWRKAVARLPDPVQRVEFIIKAPFVRPEMRESGFIVFEHLRLMQRYAHGVRAADDPYHRLLTETIEEAQSIGRFPKLDAADEAEVIMALVLARYHSLVLGTLSRSAAREGRHVWAFSYAALARNE
jgi:AcrR family transcriptional regulator